MLADIDAAEVAAAQLDGLLIRKMVLEPDGALPLNDRELDVAVSSDVFEHIPPQERVRWAGELVRISRLGQVHTFPADSRDGRWASTEADQRLDAWHRSAFGAPERWTAEHLAHAEPVVEDMLAAFPGARVHGFANTAIWLEMLQDQLSGKGAWTRGAFALRYATRLRRADQRTPFKGCLLVLDEAESPGPR